MDALGIAALAFAGGTAGNVIGRSDKVGGSTPWNKLLAPLGAILLPVIVKKVGGGDITYEQATEATLLISVAVSGVYSYGKGALELIAHLFGKKKGN